MKTKPKPKKIVLFALLSLFFLCGSLAVRKEYNRKMKAEIKVEIQASGLFDCKKKTLESVDFFAEKTVYLKTDGIRLIGNDTLYLVKNPAWLGVEHGDSIYIVNNLAFPYMPTVEQIRQKLAPTEFVFNAILGITAATWVWLTTLLMLLYLQRCGRK